MDGLVSTSHVLRYLTQVWLLHSMSLDPVKLPAPEQLAGGVADLDDAKAEMKSAPWHGPALLPGYICRRMYDIHTKEIYLFSDVMSRRQHLEDWITTDVRMMGHALKERTDHMKPIAGFIATSLAETRFWLDYERRFLGFCHGLALARLASSCSFSGSAFRLQLGICS